MIQQNFDAFKKLIGEKFYFFTDESLVWHVAGQIEEVTEHFVRLSNATYIADAGRFDIFLKEGEIYEGIFIRDCYLNLNAVSNFCPLKDIDLPVKIV